MKLILLLLVLAVSLSLTTSKVATGSENLSRFYRSSWKYLTKFAVAPGTGEFKTRFQFKKMISGSDIPEQANLSLLLYLDEDWDKIKTLDPCETKISSARLSKQVTVPANGLWSEYVSGNMYQAIRTHFWFFVLADCEKNVMPFMKANNLVWEVEVLNSDGSHFSQEENGVISPLLLVMTVIVGFFISNSIKFYKFYKTEESIDYPTLIITISLCLEFLALFFEVLHLAIYSYDGKGSFLCNLANQVLSIASQFLITCLLLLMAYGWSINFFEFEDMDVFIPLGVLLGVVHILIIGVGSFTDDDYYRYHDYENWAGVFVLVMRLLLFVVWIFLFKSTYKNAKEAEKKFFNQLGVLSSLYFTALPIMVLIATAVVAPYWRHKVVIIGTLLLQTVTLVIFTLLFTTKKNKYYQISMKGKTLLPSNKLA